MDFIEVKDVVKEYSGHRALDHVSLGVEQGSIYGLLGPNGAGKTSLIRILNQITAPDSGTVTFGGRQLVPSDVARIGYLPEERGLYKKMKVGEHIIYLGRLKGMSRTDARTEMERWLGRFDLTEWRDKKIESLSKGMAQKVQFISTVVHRPEILIFDEPFSGFDPVNAEQLKREIISLGREGATILFSTHNMSSVEEICESITLINDGKVVLQDRVDNVKQQYKKNLYRVSVAGGDMADVPDLFEIEESTPRRDGGWDSIIRLSDGAGTRDVISWLNQRYELTSFDEILPSMHEIFIETVTGNKD
ncbi:MAG: ATP-binding cassette domain-containing protein [Pseudoflavonifractor sp.]|nr:ATP-binding cassette domain-containing protein [Pseudoflavonifractor sp.]